MPFEIPGQQYVEFTHTSSALPPEATFAQYRRSASIFLVSAMALAGLSPLGQVLVQFMMV
jgi:hypothetical protein